MIQYLKLIVPLTLISPLLYVILALDYGMNTLKTNLIFSISYLIIIGLAIIMFNYLETGNLFKFSKTINKNKYISR